MKIIRTLIALSFPFVVGVACKSSDTPPPEQAPATQPAEGAKPMEGSETPAPAPTDTPAEGAPQGEAAAPQR